MRILVLDLHIVNNPNPALKIVNAVKPHFDGNLELVRFYSRDFNFQVLSDCDGIILSGLDKSRLLYSGKMQRLKSYIRKLESTTQVLGICGGYQVLATAYSHSVHELMPEVGWHTVQLTALGKRDPLFYNIKKIITPFHHHNKAVVHLSIDKILAENQRCIQAALFHPNVRGVQFHPEYSFKREISQDNDQYYQQISEEGSDWNICKKQFFSNFVSLCQSST
jgi:GMP synthase-like glutamine amidotransferase